MNEKHQSTQRSSPKISFRLLSLLLLLVGLFGLVVNLSATASAQPAVNSSEDGIWQDVAEASIQSQGPRLIEPQQYRTVTVNAAALNSRLAEAPLSNTPAAGNANVIMTLPLPDGTFARFQIVESPIMAPELAAKFPEIKTYAGQGIDDPTASVRFDQTPAGFHAIIFSPSGTIYIDPYQRGDTTHYISYFKQAYRPDGEEDFVESAPIIADQKIADEIAEIVAAARQGADGVAPSGAELRTYRLAVAATGEYTQFHGGTVAEGMAAIVTTMNRVNGIYEREVAVRMVLIANNDQLVYTNGATDPYTNSDGFAMLGQNQTAIDNVIGNANYDVGHVFSTGGGGVAYLGVPCVSGSKAGGVTGQPSPVGDPFDVDYVSHEMGHQFGANHTQNNFCNRNGSTAYEPGSASTIMGYAGICPPNLQSNSDDYFHTINFDEIIAYTTGSSGNTCPVTTDTGNTPPVPEAGTGGFSIPKDTPFTLTGSASDPDGDPVTYHWEEFDLGPGGPPSTTNAPFFRSWPALTTPSRTFPRLSDLVNNTTAVGENLPTVSYELNFRLIARDNQIGGGGVAYDSISFDVSNAAGPFLVTAPNTAVTWAAGSEQTVTWDVANTTAAPVSCSTVNLLLSTDGGITYPSTLVTDTANDGTESITVPNTSTSSARVKVECANNIFFDISNTDFTIQGGSGTTPTPGPSSTPPPTTPTVIPTPTPISTPSTSDPQIEVDPSQLSSTQPAGGQATEIFSIRNTGAQNLTWTIQEDQQRGAAEIESTDQPSEQMSPEQQIAKRQAFQQAFLADRQPAQDLDGMSATPCVAGDAGGYPCNNVDLLAFMPLAQIGGGEGNDIWGWTDPESGKEYAIMGRTNGTAFVDISDPENPVYLGNLPGINSLWGDIKVYSNHAFIVSEASGHGMQIFDLTELRDVSNPPVTFSNTAHYGGFGSAHNIVINEESGFAYAVGATTCSAGLHMVDISTPTSPTNAGCFSSDGYTHDAQCVMYNGPDTTHQGQEICFNSNEDTLTIVDVSNKNSPAQLSRTGYSGSGYTHQGWLTEDHSYFLLDDELDEQSSGHNTRTYIWDVSDLDSPSLIGTYNATTAAIDHNLYIKGQHAYQSNYRAGLRILELSDISNANLTEAAYFDIYPSSDSPSFNGSWSNYPYFESGVVIVSGIEQGLFILQPNLDGSPPPPPAEPCDAPSDISWASVSPTSGTTPPNASSSVDVTFDSTGLAMGTYTGTLCINSNDPLASLVPVPLTLTVEDSSQTINLNQGWNKIGLSVEPTSPIMAQSLCAEMGNIVEINRWHAGGWDGHICGQTFNNFTLEINNGYFIQSDAVATWNLQGLPINSPTLDLQIGWNSISLPHTDGYTAESLCDEIISQGVTAVEINRWYAGGWDGHICNQTFNDFPINRGEGYFIKSTTAGPVTPPAVAQPSAGQQPSEGVPQVGSAMPIHDLVVGNLRDTSVTLSWTTEEATTGYVRANTGNRLPENQKVALDIRGASTSSRTHVVLLDNLAPETTYQLEVISGVDGAETTQITVTTAPTLQSIPSSDTIYGQVFQADGVTPAPGGLVHLTLKDADGAGSDGEAKLISAIVDAEGYWHANLGNARTADLDAYFKYSPQGDQLLIQAQGRDGQSATLTVDTADDAQALNITLASIPTALEVATYQAAPASTPWQAGVLLVTFLLAAAGWSRRKTQLK